MFEKEAEEYQIRKHHQRLYGHKPVVMKELNTAYKDGFKDGYNKANKWQHGTPDTGKDLLCQTAPDEFEVGYYHPEDERFYTLDGMAIDVLAWKEIVPPEEIER
jgi:hypothetical protein